MLNPMNIYIGRLAEEARQECNNQNIIANNQLRLDQSVAEQIISFFGGRLQKFTEGDLTAKFPDKNISNSFIQVTNKSKSEFIIGYINFSALDILHELGHAFLELDTMENEDVRWIGDEEGGIKEIEASQFARAFLMPTELFQEVVIDNSVKGYCNIDAVANVFCVDESQVICRGRESYLWE